MPEGIPRISERHSSVPSPDWSSEHLSTYLNRAYLVIVLSLKVPRLVLLDFYLRRTRNVSMITGLFSWGFSAVHGFYFCDKSRYKRDPRDLFLSPKGSYLVPLLILPSWGILFDTMTSTFQRIVYKLEVDHPPGLNHTELFLSVSIIIFCLSVLYINKISLNLEWRSPSRATSKSHLEALEFRRFVGYFPLPQILSANHTHSMCACVYIAGWPTVSISTHGWLSRLWSPQVYRGGKPGFVSGLAMASCRPSSSSTLVLVPFTMSLSQSWPGRVSGSGVVYGAHLIEVPWLAFGTACKPVSVEAACWCFWGVCGQALTISVSRAFSLPSMKRGLIWSVQQMVSLQVLVLRLVTLCVSSSFGSSLCQPFGSPSTRCTFLLFLSLFKQLNHSCLCSRHLFTAKAICVPIAGIIFFVWAIVKAKGVGPIVRQPSTIHGSKLAWTMVASLMSCISNMATLVVNAPDFASRATTPGAAVIPQLISVPIGFSMVSFLGIIVSSSSTVIFGEAVWSPIDLLNRWAVSQIWWNLRRLMD